MFREMDMNFRLKKAVNSVRVLIMTESSPSRIDKFRAIETGACTEMPMRCHNPMTSTGSTG